MTQPTISAERIEEMLAGLEGPVGVAVIRGNDLADVRSAMTLALSALRAQAQGSEAVAVETQWRNLALQFDEHRISAMSMLRYAIASIEQYATVRDILREPLSSLKVFHSAPPLSGEAVLARRLSALATPPAPVDAPTHRHVKRGTEYVLLGIGKMQTQDWYEQGHDIMNRLVYETADMAEVAIYRSVNDGSLWARPREEFEDGRFEALTASRAAVAQDETP